MLLNEPSLTKDKALKAELQKFIKYRGVENDEGPVRQLSSFSGKDKSQEESIMPSKRASQLIQLSENLN